MPTISLNNTGSGPAAQVSTSVPNNTTTTYILANNTDSVARFGAVTMATNVTLSVTLPSGVVVSGITDGDIFPDVQSKSYVVISAVSTETTGTHTFNFAANTVTNGHGTSAQNAESIYIGTV